MSTLVQEKTIFVNGCYYAVNILFDAPNLSCEPLDFDENTPI